MDDFGSDSTFTRPKLSKKFIILGIILFLAVALAIASAIFRPQGNRSLNEGEKAALVFSNYLIIGQEVDTPLPEYKEDANYYIADIITQNNKEVSLSYLNRAKELYDTFKAKNNFSKFEETNADFANEQGYDLDFLIYLINHPAPTLNQIIAADDLSEEDILKYLEGDNSEVIEQELPSTVNNYVNKFHKLKSSFADNYASDYYFSAYYDLYESALKLEKGCTLYSCNIDIDISDDEAFAELVDESYNNMINTPFVAAASIAASSYDIIEEFAK